MGRIKSTLIKRTTKQLMHKEEMFNDQFDHNKKILGSTMPSKKVRNKIAGYMARLKRAEKEAAKRALKREQAKAAQLAALPKETPDYQFEQF